MKQKCGPREASQRQLRVGEQIRHVIAETLQRGHFHDEALLDAGRVTVAEVRVSPDLKHAKAYVMTLGGEDMDDILPALNDASSYFQQEVNRKTALKFTPRICFVRDDTFDEADRIEKILRDIPKPRGED
ncbi:MAG: 30S ribosome-binding factor RbfA [Alphaproteobacteria bacterium]|nr:30S ribosome-binding factor RbfA [Alphaproteobacteria bacterium]